MSAKLKRGTIAFANCAPQPGCYGYGIASDRGWLPEGTEVTIEEVHEKHRKALVSGGDARERRRVWVILPLDDIEMTETKP